MSRHCSTRSRKTLRPVGSPLTEANLRLHSLAYHEVCIANLACFHMGTNFDGQTSSGNRVSLPEEHSKIPSVYNPLQLGGDFDEGDDESIEAAQLSVALRKAASLEALQAYGGCFVSGFLAMQVPLPWSSPKYKSKVTNQHVYLGDAAQRNPVRKHSLETSTISSYNSNDSPRPDSETLSVADIRELESGQSWRRRSLGWRVAATTSRPRR